VCVWERERLVIGFIINTILSLEREILSERKIERERERDRER